MRGIGRDFETGTEYAARRQRRRNRALALVAPGTISSGRLLLALAAAGCVVVALLAMASLAG